MAITRERIDQLVSAIAAITKENYVVEEPSGFTGYRLCIRTNSGGLRGSFGN